MTPAKPKKPASFSGSVKKHLRAYFAAHDGELPPCGLYDRIICEVERILIAESLKLTKKNQIKTAKLLGINRNTLTKKIKQHGLLPAESTKRKKAQRRL